MIEAYGDIHEGGWPMHDALALASIVHPPVISKTPATIEVVTAPGERRGQTLVQFIDAGHPRPRAHGFSSQQMSTLRSFVT